MRKRRAKVTSKILARMRELRKTGLAYRKIASELGLSPMTVYKRLKASKAKPKRKGFFERLFGK